MNAITVILWGGTAFAFAYACLTAYLLYGRLHPEDTFLGKRQQEARRPGAKGFFCICMAASFICVPVLIVLNACLSVF